MLLASQLFGEQCRIDLGQWCRSVGVDGMNTQDVRKIKHSNNVKGLDKLRTGTTAMNATHSTRIAVRI